MKRCVVYGAASPRRHSCPAHRPRPPPSQVELSVSELVEGFLKHNRRQALSQMKTNGEGGGGGGLEGKSQRKSQQRRAKKAQTQQGRS